MKARVTLTGTASLLMNSSRMANPLDEFAKALKEVTGKRTKTEADHAEMARIEHAGGLYIDPDVGPFLPADNIWRSIYDAAKKHKLGEQIKPGLLVTTEINPLDYKGPRTAAALWEDKNFVFTTSVKTQRARVMRTRPIFAAGWGCEFEILTDDNLINPKQIVMILETAGTMVGIGDWRPRYGRYESVIVKL